MASLETNKDDVGAVQENTAESAGYSVAGPLSARILLSLPITIAALIFLSVGAFNFAVDPYGLRQWPGEWSWNAEKPLAIYNDRLGKAAMLRRDPMDCIVSGNSRMSEGYPLDHPIFSGCKSVRDLSLAGASFSEQKQFLDAAYRNKGIALSIVGLDYLNFNAYRRPIRGFSADALSPGSIGAIGVHLSKIFSVDTYYDSHETIKRQGSVAFLFPNGSADDAFLEQARNSRSTRGQALATMWGYIGHDLAMPAYDFALDLPSSHPLSEFRALLDDDYRSGRKVVLVVNPVHAWMLTLAESLGFANDIRLWKQKLVEINEAAAAAASREPFPLFDFSGYNDVTTDPIPKDDGDTTPLRYYWDPSHFRRHVGAMILDRVAAATSQPDGFGVRLTGKTFSQHIEAEAAAAAEWRLRNSQDVAEVERVVACLGPVSHRYVAETPDLATCRKTVLRSW